MALLLFTVVVWSGLFVGLSVPLILAGIVVGKYINRYLPCVAAALLGSFIFTLIFPIKEGAPWFLPFVWLFAAVFPPALLAASIGFWLRHAPLALLAKQKGRSGP